MKGGPFLLVGDHAGRAIPASLGDLGLAAEDRARHIALDIGIAELGPALGEALGAPFVSQGYSRLVIDCNRDPASAEAVPAVSDGTRIPGNEGLSAAARASRVAEVFAPYHRAIAEVLDARAAAGLATVLVALHSFTPVMDGIARECEIGVLHGGGDERFARALLARLEAEGSHEVRDNQPYALNEIDYTIPHHAFARGLPYVELEVRQDLIDPRAPRSIAAMADLLARALAASADYSHQ